MAAGGLRMNLVSSTLSYYTPKEGNKSQGISVQKLKHFGVGFNKMIQDTVFRDNYTDLLRYVKSKSLGLEKQYYVEEQQCDTTNLCRFKKSE